MVGGRVDEFVTESGAALAGPVGGGSISASDPRCVAVARAAGSARDRSRHSSRSSGADRRRTGGRTALGRRGAKSNTVDELRAGGGAGHPRRFPVTGPYSERKLGALAWILRRRRSRSRRRRHAVASPVPAVEFAGLVPAAASELPFAQAQALWLVDVCGCTYADAAAEVRTTRGDIVRRVAGGREALCRRVPALAWHGEDRQRGCGLRGDGLEER